MKKNYDYILPLYSVFPTNILFDRELDTKSKLLFISLMALSDEDNVMREDIGDVIELAGIGFDEFDDCIKKLIDKNYINDLGEHKYRLNLGVFYGD